MRKESLGRVLQDLRVSLLVQVEHPRNRLSEQDSDSTCGCQALEEDRSPSFPERSLSRSLWAVASHRWKQPSLARIATCPVGSRRAKCSTTNHGSGNTGNRVHHSRTGHP